VKESIDGLYSRNAWDLIGVTKKNCYKCSQDGQFMACIWYKYSLNGHQ